MDIEQIFNLPDDSPKNAQNKSDLSKQVPNNTGDRNTDEPAQLPPDTSLQTMKDKEDDVSQSKRKEDEKQSTLKQTATMDTGVAES